MTQLNELMASHTHATSDRLEALSDRVREVCNLDKSIADAEERLASLKRQRAVLVNEALPEMFGTLGISSLEVEARGNYPAYVARLTPYYHASISSKWDAPRRALAFATLDRLSLNGLIKAQVTCEFNREQVDEARVLARELEERGIASNLDQEVHWKSLTAAVAELCETNRCPTDADLKNIGAQVGKVVIIKPRS